MKIFTRILGALFSMGFIAFLAVSAFVSYVLWDRSQDLPDYAKLNDYTPPVMTRVHAGDGRLLAEYARERRLFLPIQSIPDRIINAFISAEDKNFWTHPGVDYEGLVRAVFYNLKNYGERRAQGASTITQQVAKNFLLTNERSLDRKIKEMLLSFRIEGTFSKERILELYLNEIFLGLKSYGIAAAALNYFGKSVHELTVSEAAYLAALPKAPNNYHPTRFHDQAIERRNWVIDRMVENGYLQAEEGEKAKNDPLRIVPRNLGAQIYAAEYFAEEVRREVIDRYGEDTLYGGGLSVRTTLNPEYQQVAKAVLNDALVKYDQATGWRGPVKKLDRVDDWHRTLKSVNAIQDVPGWRLAAVLSVDEQSAQIGLQPLPGSGQAQAEYGLIPLSEMKWARPTEGPNRYSAVKGVSTVLSVGDVVYVAEIEGQNGVFKLRQIPEISGGIVVMDPWTGRVHALVGGFSYDDSVFNRATQAQRQPGSSIKPFVYAAALDNGYSPSSVILDAPVVITQKGQKPWKPNNYTNRFYGPSTLRTGIEKSRNAMTVRLAQDMGMPMVAEYAERFGIYDDMPHYFAYALGSGETTLMRMTTAYSMLANGGRKITPTLIDRIQDRYGKTVYKHDQRECVGCQVPYWAQDGEPELIDHSKEVINPLTAYQVTSMLQGVVERGTAAGIKRVVDRPFAGKTGTTNDYKDAWFVGFTPNLAIGVYVGYDNPRSMGRSMTGGSAAAPIVADFVARVAGDDRQDFLVPSDIHFERIDPKSGLRVASGGIMEAFKPNQSPANSYSIIGYEDDQGRRLTVNPESDRTVTSGTGGLY